MRRSSFFQRNYFNDGKNRFSQHYLLSPTPAQQEEFLHITQFIHTKKHDEIVDFGSGNGRTTFFFLRRGINVLAVDISEQSLKELRTVYKKNKHPSWGKLRTATAIPASQTFSTIVGTDILHHVPLLTTFTMLKNHLKPGGTIVFSEPNAFYIFWYLYCLWKRLPWNIEKGLIKCSYPNLYSILHQSGYTNINIEGHGAIPTPLLGFSQTLCHGNARHWGNVLPFFSFRLIITAQNKK